MNARVDEINDRMLDRLPGREMVYWSHDTVKEGNVPNLHGDVLADYLGMLYEPRHPFSQAKAEGRSYLYCSTKLKH